MKKWIFVALAAIALAASVAVGGAAWANAQGGTDCCDAPETPCCQIQQVPDCCGA